MKKSQSDLPVPSTDEEGGKEQGTALGWEICSRSGSMCLMGSGKSSSAQAGNFWAAVSFS